MSPDRFPSAVQSKPFAPSASLLRRAVLLLTAVALSVSLAACDSVGTEDEEEMDAPSPPAAPSGLSAQSGNGQIALSWDAADDADTYRVYRSTSSGVDTSASALARGLSSTNYTDSDAENGTTYYYAVSSVKEEDVESGPSGEVAKTPFSDPPDRP